MALKLKYPKLHTRTQSLVIGYWKEEEKKVEEQLFSNVPDCLQHLSAVYHGDVDHFHPMMYSKNARTSDQNEKLEAKKDVAYGYGQQVIGDVANITYKWQLKVKRKTGYTLGEVRFGITTNIDPATFENNYPFNPERPEDDDSYIVRISDLPSRLYNYAQPKSIEWNFCSGPANCDAYSITLNGEDLVFSGNGLMFCALKVERKLKSFRFCAWVDRRSTITITNFEME